jgi:acetamidase/formamidase
MSGSSWIGSSIMAARGLARGEARAHHNLTEARQGKFHFVCGPYATPVLEIDLIKGWSFAWPRLETADFIMTIGSARPMEDAARIAYRELIRWMVADYGWEELDAYMFLSQAGRVRLGNMVDPKYTLGASVAKTYLMA